MNNVRDCHKLSNGVEIPCVGFGTWQSPDGEIAVNAVKEAIRVGYRHIDTAAIYGNEKSVGKAIKESGIDRRELFVTSKVWRSELGYEKTKAAFEKTLNDLQLEYLDLYLIHWPASFHKYENWEDLNRDTWKAMLDLYQEGKIRAIGVANFLPHHLRALMEFDVKPMVDQIEFHPGYMQEEAVAFCKDHGILVEAWSPLGSGRILQDERLQAMAKSYGKSVAQLCVRWCMQNGTLPLPKSVTAARIAENSNVFDFVISEKDMAAINTLPTFGESGAHPDK